MKRAIFAGFLILCLPLVLVAERYEVDTEKSIITWVGKKVSGAHDGTVRLDSGNVGFSNGKVRSGTFVINLASIVNVDMQGSSYQKKLEDHLKSDDFFNVSKFPTATFKITSVDGDTISGDLTVKGITMPVEFPATIDKVGETYVAKADLTIDRTKWDIRYNSGKFFDPKNLGDKLIYDEIEIDLELYTK